MSGGSARADRSDRAVAIAVDTAHVVIVALRIARRMVKRNAPFPSNRGAYAILRRNSRPSDVSVNSDAAMVTSNDCSEGTMDDFLRFPSAVKHDPAIDAWLLAQRDDLRPFVETW